MIKLTEEQLHELLRKSWFAGQYESRYTPNASSSANRHAREAIKDLKDA